MWSFAIGIFLIYLHPQSLLVTAIYLLTNRLFVLALSGPIGRKVDSLARLPTMRTSLVVQNSSVALAAILTVVAFQLDITYYCSRALFFVVVSLITMLGIVSQLSSSASKMIIERDWVVVLSKNDPELLSSINANMRRIDQVCVLLAPIIAGAFMTGLSTTWAAVLIAVWNIVSFFVEYSLLRVVYSRVPELAVKAMLQEKAGPKLAKEVASVENAPPIFFDVMKKATSSYFDNVKIFLSQEVSLPGICLSLVYLTALGFSSVTVGYLRLNNVKDLYIGIIMALGALFGIMGTIVYTPFTKKFGVSVSGVLGAVCIAVSYAVCFASIGFPRGNLEFVPQVTEGKCEEIAEDPFSDISGPISTHTIILLVGIATIRFGLWIYDLAISQLFQMSVPEKQRNTVGGIQLSFNSFFDCLYIILTAIMSDPNQFYILISISCVSCIGSCIIYICWYLKSGGLKVKKEPADPGELADLSKVTSSTVYANLNSTPIEEITGDNKAITGDSKEITGDNKEISGNNEEISGDNKDINVDIENKETTSMSVDVHNA